MRCIICRHGTTSMGTVTVTLERGAATVVFQGVPASICDNCGEEYLSEEVSRRLLELADEAAARDVDLEVRQYRAA